MSKKNKKVKAQQLSESRNAENPSIPLSSASLLSVFGVENSYTGKAVTESSALATHIAVNRCVSLLSGTIASLPLKTYRGNGPDRKEVKSSLLDVPHPDLTPFDLWRLVSVHLLGWGNAYLAIERNGAGTPVFLHPIEPWRVRVEKVVATPTNPEGKRFHISVDSGPAHVFTSYDVLHIPGMGYDGIQGLSTIGVARQSIAASLAAEEYAGRFYGSGSMQGGILSHEEDVTTEQAEEAKRRWKESVAGLSKAHEIAVLGNGAKFIPVSMSQQDSQFIETRHFGVEEIAHLYGLTKDLTPPPANEFLKFTLLPYLKTIEGRVSKLLPRGTFAEFVVEGLLRADTTTRYNGYAVLTQNGIATAEECRLFENWSVVPEVGQLKPLGPNTGTPQGSVEVGPQEDDKED